MAGNHVQEVCVVNFGLEVLFEAGALCTLVVQVLQMPLLQDHAAFVLKSMVLIAHQPAEFVKRLQHSGMDTLGFVEID